MRKAAGLSISTGDIAVNEAISWVYFCGLPDSRSEMFRFLAIEPAVIFGEVKQILG